MQRSKCKKKVMISCLITMISISICGCTADKDYSLVNSNVVTQKTETSSDLEKKTVQFTSSDDYIERPEYVASEYVTLNDYSSYDASDIHVPDVTAADIASKLLSEMIKYNVIPEGTIETPALTNETVAILSEQEFQKSDDYMENLKKEIKESFYWETIGEIYDQIYDIAVDTAKDLTYPEDVYTYELYSDDNYQYLSNFYSMSADEFKVYIDENSVAKEFTEEITLYKLKEEVIVAAFNEKENFSFTEDDYQRAYQVMCDHYGERTVDQLYESYGKETVNKEAQKLLTAEALAINAGFNNTSGN